MPSAQSLPTVADFLAAYSAAVRGAEDDRADLRRGAIYEHPSGAAAILYTRDAVRDRDMFRAVYFDTAAGDDLTNLISQRYGIDRILDSYGTGTALFTRPNASHGSDTIYEGTRIRVTPASQNNDRIYAVAADTSASASATAVQVPIRALVTGPGQAIAVTSGLVLDDALADSSWSVASLSCGDGTTYESADDFRARVRATRLLQRRGYVPSIVRACQAAGAASVLAFESFWGTDITQTANDYGINALYVGDNSGSSSSALVAACHIALEGARPLGAQFVVGPIATTQLAIALTVALVDSPGLFDTNTLSNAIAGSVAGYFRGVTNGYTYKLDAIAAAARVSADVQNVTVTSPAADVTLSSAAWPATLTRYAVDPSAVTVTFTGPT